MVRSVCPIQWPTNPKGAGFSDEPGQSNDKLSANDTSWCPRLLKTGPQTKQAMGIVRGVLSAVSISPLIRNGL